MATSAPTTVTANVSGLTQVALDGYDPVSFFDNENNTGAPGNFQIQSTHHGATYFFKDEANKAKFEADPDHYVPQVSNLVVAVQTTTRMTLSFCFVSNGVIVVSLALSFALCLHSMAAIAHLASQSGLFFPWTWLRHRCTRTSCILT